MTLEFTNAFTFPQDEKSVYNEIFSYLFYSILPDYVLDKPESKVNTSSRRTMQTEAIMTFKRTCSSDNISK